MDARRIGKRTAANARVVNSVRITPISSTVDKMMICLVNVKEYILNTGIIIQGINTMVMHIAAIVINKAVSNLPIIKMEM